MLFGLLLLACVPEEDEIDYSHIQAPPVLGTYGALPDSVVFYQEFNPALLVSVTYDSQNLFGAAEQSLDITGDNVADIRFILQTIHPDSNISLNNIAEENIPSFILEALNTGYSVKTITEDFEVGGIWIEVDRIARMPGSFVMWDYQFKSLDSLAGILWGDKESGDGLNQILGDWYKSDEIRFIGIQKHPESLYGWIKLDTFKPDSVRILEVVLGKN